MVKYYIKQAKKKKKDNITIYRLDHKGDVGCSQKVFFLFESGTGVTLKLCMCMLHFILNLKLLPFPPPPPKKKSVPRKLSCQNLQSLTFKVRFVSLPINGVSHGQPTHWVKERLT